MPKIKRKPWVVIDLMTGEHVDRFDTETEALKKFAKSGYDILFWK